MKKNVFTGALETAYKAEQFFDLEPRIKELADLSVLYIDNIDSTNINHTIWEKIVDVISANYKKYDGFLITHGTNTLGYTSSALSFALPNIGKPVILTGSQIPAAEVHSDARNNLVNSIRVATMDLAGVFIVFGSKIILGCRAKKVSEADLEAFKTFQDSDFGEIRVNMKINKSCNQKHNKKLIVRNGFDDNIVCLTLIPGLKSEHLNSLMNNGVKGFVFRAFGSGDIPSQLFSALAYAKEKKVPVLATTQCPTGVTALGLNEIGRQSLEYGVIQVFDMSMEAMSTKLMWAIKHKIPYSRIKQFIQTNLVGEIKPESSILY